MGVQALKSQTYSLNYTYTQKSLRGFGMLHGICAVRGSCEIQYVTSFSIFLRHALSVVLAEHTRVRAARARGVSRRTRCAHFDSPCRIPLNLALAQDDRYVWDRAWLSLQYPHLQILYHGYRYHTQHTAFSCVHCNIPLHTLDRHGPFL